MASKKYCRDISTGTSLPFLPTHSSLTTLQLCMYVESNVKISTLFSQRTRKKDGAPAFREGSEDGLNQNRTGYRSSSAHLSFGSACRTLSSFWKPSFKTVFFAFSRVTEIGVNRIALVVAAPFGTVVFVSTFS